jgi:hypothetical protein
MNLEIPKHLIIWDGGSSYYKFTLDLNYSYIKLQWLFWYNF